MAIKRSSKLGKIDTIIGEDSIVEGNILSKSSLRIDGKVLGDIRSEGDIMIGVKGAVSSNIHARNVHVAGMVDGTITTSQTLSITPTGKVNGSIHVSSLEVAEGGVFQGTSHMDPAGNQKGSRDHRRHEHSHPERKSKAQIHKLEKEAAAK